MLKALGLPVSAEQTKAIAIMERQYLPRHRGPQTLLDFPVLHRRVEGFHQAESWILESSEPIRKEGWQYASVSPLVVFSGIS